MNLSKEPQRYRLRRKDVTIFMTSHILSDNPLENPKDDRLGYAPFAKNIITSLHKMTTDECLVFSLCGDWGTGKSSILNFVEYYNKEMADDERFIVVRFNPWLFSGQSNLLQQFFKQIRVTLGKDKKFKEVAGYLSDLIGAIAQIPTLDSAYAVKWISKLFKFLSKDEDISAIRNEIKNHLSKQKTRILVIIDDVDRLHPEEIKGLFGFIKAIADFPKTFYLVAFDKKVVVEALQTTLGISGDEYIEKIVQVPFELPHIDKLALQKLLFEELDAIIGDTDEKLFDKVYWGNVFHDGLKYFVNSVRNIKRVTNALKVTYPLLKNEVNPIDFIAIEFVRIFCPDIYQLIKDNDTMFAGHSRDEGLSSNRDELKAFHEKWPSSIEEPKGKIMKALLTRLFPKLESVFNNTTYNADWLQDWKKKLRICHPEKFDIYFRYSLPQGSISNIEMRSLLALAKEPASFSNMLLGLLQKKRPDGTTMLSHFLSEIQDYTEKDIPQEHIPNILQSIFDVGDKLIVKEDEGRGLFSDRPFGNDMEMSRLVYQLLKRYSTEKERVDILKHTMSTGNAVATIIREVSMLEKKDKKARHAEDGSELDVGEDRFAELKQIAVTKIKQMAHNDTFLNNPSLPTILFRWCDWDDAVTVKEHVKKITTSDENLVIFMATFLGKGYSSSITDRVQKVKWRFDIKSLGELVDITAISARCSDILEMSPTWLDKDKKFVLTKFNEAYTKHSIGTNKTDDWLDDDDDE